MTRTMMTIGRFTAHYFTPYVVCGWRGNWRVYHENDPTETLATYTTVADAKRLAKDLMKVTP